MSAGPTTPNLAGQSQRYLLAAMRNFANGNRPATVMGRLARGYSETDLAAVAEYYSRLSPAPPVSSIDPGKVARGRELQEQYCARCHKEGGRRFEFEDFVGPILAGQPVEYLRLAMDEFVFRDRDMPTEMGLKYIGRSRADFEALAHFYAAQSR